MVKVRFSAQLPVSGVYAKPDNILRAAQEAEANGYDVVTQRDHIEWDPELHAHHATQGHPSVGTDPGDPNLYECVSTLSYLAGRTERIGLGTAIFLIPSRDPRVGAKQWSTLDVLSQGRLILGVGVGNISHKSELDKMGVPYLERGQICDEYLKVMKELWTKPRVTFHGKYIHIDDFYMYPKPLQKPHPPLLIGGFGRVAQRRTAELGDGWLPMHTVEGIRDGIEYIGRRAREVGRGDKEFIFGYKSYAIIAKTEDEARRRHAASVETITELTQRPDVTRISAEEQVQRNLVGTPDRIISKLSKYVDVGVNFVDCSWNTGTYEEYLESIRLFGKEVIPSFR